MEPSTRHAEDDAVDVKQMWCPDCYAVQNRCKTAPSAKSLAITPIPPLGELLRQMLLSENQTGNGEIWELESSLKHWLEAFDSDDPACFERLTNRYEFQWTLTRTASTTAVFFSIACCANRPNLMQYFLDKSGKRLHDLSATVSPSNSFYRHVIDNFYSLSKYGDIDRFKDLMDVFGACDDCLTVFWSILCERLKYVDIDLPDLPDRQTSYRTHVSCVEVMITGNQKKLLTFLFEELETIIDGDDTFVNLFKDVENLTPLMLAAVYCDSEIIRTILGHLKKKQGPHNKRNDSSSHCPQQQQKQSGNYIGRRLKLNGFTATHFAVCYNRSDVIELLLESGGMEQTENRCGFPLAFALSLRQTHRKIVNKCLSAEQSDKVEEFIKELKGADVDSNQKQTGVHCNETERIENVLDDLPSSNTESCAVVQPLCDVITYSDVVASVDSGVLYDANVFDSLDRIQAFSLKVDKRSQRGKPKCCYGRKNSLGSEVDYLLKKFRVIHRLSTWLNLSEVELRWKSLLGLWSDQPGDDKNPLNWEDDEGNNCFHVAARHNYHQLLSTFLQKLNQDNFHWTNNSGETALHLAVAYGHVESVRILAKQVKRILTITTENEARNVLHIAAWENQVEIIRIILFESDEATKHSLCYAKDKDGDTPLNLAVFKENVECVRALGPLSDANIANKNSCNALHLASATGDACLLLAVLETCHRPNDKSRSYLDALDNLDNTPLMICINNGHSSGVRSLLEHGADLEKGNEKGKNVAQLVAQNAAQNSGKMVAVWNVICEFSYEKAVNEIMYADEIKDCVEKHRQKKYRNARSKLFRLTRTRVQLSSRTNDVDRQSSDVKPQKESDCELTALEIASRYGHTDILKAMIECCSTFCNGQFKYYDVSGLIPLPYDKDNSVHSSPSRPNCSSSHNNQSPGQLIELNSRSHHAVKASSSPTASQLDPSANNSSNLPARTSCLELIAEQPTDVVVRALEIDPIKQFISKISLLRRLIFFLLLIFHVVHMSCFTQYVMPTCNFQPIANRLPNVSNATATVERLSYDRTFGLFLMWPAVIFLMEAAYLLKSLYRGCVLVKDWFNRFQTDSDIVDHLAPSNRCLEVLKLEAEKLTDKLVHEYQYVSSLLKGMKAVHFKLAALFSLHDTWQIDAVVSRVSRLGFCAIMATWFSYYVTFSTYADDDVVENYATVTSVTLVFGWMLTLEYLRGIQLIYTFVTVVKTIFYRDVIRVMIIFGFMWIAFSCAMRIFITLVQTRSGSPATMTLASSVYEMYNTMLGHGALYDWTNAWSGEWTSTLRNDTIVVFSLIYSVFLLLATIVLLNVLIAMMNNTYQEVLQISDSLWNVECLQLVAWMTRDNFFGTRTLYYYFVKHFVLYRFDAQSGENDKEKVDENGLGLDDVTDGMRGKVTEAKVAGDNDEHNRKCLWAMETSDLPPAVKKLWSKLFEQEPEQLTDNALEQNHLVTVVDANSLRLSAIENTLKKICEKMEVSTDI